MIIFCASGTREKGKEKQGVFERGSELRLGLNWRRCAQLSWRNDMQAVSLMAVSVWIRALLKRLHRNTSKRSANTPNPTIHHYTHIHTHWHHNQPWPVLGKIWNRKKLVQMIWYASRNKGAIRVIILANVSEWGLVWSLWITGKAWSCTVVVWD